MPRKTLMDYRQISGDPFHDARVSTSFGLAAFGKSGDLLGGSQRSLQEKLLGKWNDDLIWWALSILTGAEVYGKDAVMIGSVPFLDVAIKTWGEIVEPGQWDEATCRGGFFWSPEPGTLQIEYHPYSIHSLVRKTCPFDREQDLC